MIRALTPDATIDIPAELVDETRYFFRTRRDNEGVIVSPAAAQGMTPDKLLDVRLDRLATALSPDFSVTERYQRNAGGASAVGVAYAARVLGAEVSARTLVVDYGGRISILEITSSRAEEVESGVFRTLAAPDLVGCPSPPGSIRAFTQFYSFDLPHDFAGPTDFELRAQEGAVTIELCPGAPPSVEQLIYCDPGSSPEVTEEASFDVDRSHLQRWSVRVTHLGEPRTACFVMSNLPEGPRIIGKGPGSEASTLEKYVFTLTQTLVVRHHA